jgi:hypothetical protein
LNIMDREDCIRPESQRWGAVVFSLVTKAVIRRLSLFALPMSVAEVCTYKMAKGVAFGPAVHGRIPNATISPSVKTL